MIREENRVREYRLTSLGIKNRGKYEREERSTGLEGLTEPA